MVDREEHLQVGNGYPWNGNWRCSQRRRGDPERLCALLVL